MMTVSTKSFEQSRGRGTGDWAFSQHLSYIGLHLFNDVSVEAVPEVKFKGFRLEVLQCGSVGGK